MNRVRRPHGPVGKRGRKGEDTPWITYPDRQLIWPAVGFHGKDHWADVLSDFPSAEEAQDYPPREDVRVRESLPIEALQG